MRYTRRIENIKELMTNYKNDIDTIIDARNKYKATLEAVNNNGIRIHSDELVKSELNDYDAQIPDKIRRTREKTKALVNANIDAITNEMDRFFNASVTTTLADKVRAIRDNNLTLSQKEYDLLCKDVRGFYDLRIVSQLAKDQAKKGISFDGDITGKMADYTINLHSAINGEDINIDKPYSAINRMKSMLMNTLDNYCGDNLELKYAIAPREKIYDRKTNTMVDAPFDAYEVGMMSKASENIRNYSYIDEYVSTIKPMYAVLPRNQRKKELSESEINLIDAIIDPRFPYSAESTIKEVCVKTPELMDLFELDPRYADIVDKIDLSESNMNE